MSTSPSSGSSEDAAPLPALERRSFVASNALEASTLCESDDSARSEFRSSVGTRISAAVAEYQRNRDTTSIRQTARRYGLPYSTLQSKISEHYESVPVRRGRTPLVPHEIMAETFRILDLLVEDKRRSFVTAKPIILGLFGVYYPHKELPTLSPSWWRHQVNRHESRPP